MSGGRAPSGAATPATVALTAAGIAFTAHAYEHHDT
ncbi:MAG: Cys-tRNA(Pro) deacylase, partial [Alphaproteobacteria bacterium]